jgi:hypothetical protein
VTTSGRPAGRPRLRSERRRRALVVPVRMTDSEYASAKGLADQYDLTVPEMMRRLLEALLNRVRSAGEDAA